MAEQGGPRVPRLSTLSLMDLDEASLTDDDFYQIMTPSSKRTPQSIQEVDEDSGLGMEFDQMKPSCIKFDSPATFDEANDSFGELIRPFAGVNKDTREVRRPLFSGRKRLLAVDNKGSYSKRRREATSPRKTLMKKSLSFDSSPLANHEEEFVVMSVNRLVEEKNLIGDGSCSFSLPTIPGKHSDLTSISCHTAADLLNGRYNDVVGSYTLIDSRYPYEYEGGHIKTAINIHWREEQQVEKLLHSRDNMAEGMTRHIILFYCEFSSERGPKMCRTFRQKDRALNKDNYPHLNFPELYLLHDGYKAFYESYPELCEPSGYKPMLHKDHAADLRHFRSKSKSWSNGDKSRKRAQKLF